MSSIRKNLAVLVLLAALPALAILLYTGIEQRQRSIEQAKRDVALLAHTIAESQSDVSRVTRQTLSTLALLPQIQALDVQASNQLFKTVIEKNPGYYNLSLVDLAGNVIASNQLINNISLADRKHFLGALKDLDFAAGEFIVTRMGSPIPVFPFAYPVLDEQGRPVAVLTMVIDLSFIADFYQPSLRTKQSFLAATDHQGLRLFYYPTKESTNPVGQPIKASSWEMASLAQEPGILIGAGSDGVRRIFAFEQVRLSSDAAPYMYVWAGIPEPFILGPANATLFRNLFIMLIVAALSLIIAWTIGRNAFITPINNLIGLTLKYAEGKLEARAELPDKHNEFWVLIKAFHEMADSLQHNQSELVKSEEKTRLILNSAAEAIYGLDRSGHCTFCNQSCLDMLGYRSEQELIGRNMHELIHLTTSEGTPVPAENCRIFRSFRDGNNIHVDDEVFWKADGTCFPAEYWSHLVKSNGEVVGAVVTFIDISKRKLAAKEREELIAQLQDKTTEQERFIYTISHDLKSPLVTITGFLGIIEKDIAAGKDSDFKANLAMIANAAQRMNQLLNDLLELSRVGIKKHQPEQVNLGDLASKAIANVSGKIEEMSALVEVAPELPDIVVVPQNFLQVFENLITNAVKFSASAKNGPVVTIGVRRDNGQLVCCVKDNGIGIEPRYTNKVFDLFEKLDQDSGGTGVGLAIVKRIVEAHGGRIWTESEGLGQGTAFCFTLPEAQS